MTFWDWLNTSLGYAPLRKDPLARLDNAVAKASLGLNLNGIAASNSGDSPSGTDPHEVDIATAISQLQKRSSGFNVTDIKPMKLSGSQYSLLLPLSAVTDILGLEYDDLNLQPSPPLQNFANNTTGTAWRTIQLPILGNFLKIEFLPTQSNFQINTISQNDTANSLRKIDLGYSQLDDGAVNIFNTANNSPHSAQGTTTYYEREINRQILIQFDSISNPLMIAKTGEVFKTPFSSVFIHCKTGCPPFRIISGYNSEVVSPQDNRVMNSNPAFGPGHGLWEGNGSRHCVGFSIGTGGDPGANALITVASPVNNVLVNTVFNQKVTGVTSNQPIPNNVNAHGLAIGWITNMNLSIISQGNAGDGNGQIWLQVSSAISSYSKIILSLPFTYKKGTAANVFVSFNIPKRFVLKPGYRLDLMINHSNTSNETINMQYSIDGYVYGKILTGLPVSGHPVLATVPGFQMDTVTIDPFPLDQLEVQTY